MKIVKWVLRAPLYVLRVAALVATLFFLNSWMTSPFQDFTVQRHTMWFFPSLGIQILGAYLIFEPAKEKSNWWKAAYVSLAVFTVFLNQIGTFHLWIAALLIIVYPLKGTSKLMAIAGAGFLYHVLVGIFWFGEPLSFEVVAVAISMAVFFAVHLYLSRKGEEDGHGHAPAHGGHKPAKTPKTPKPAATKKSDDPKDAW